MVQIKFKIAAKTDVGLVRTNNEDNFQASSDLRIAPMRWINNELCQLGEKGALLVVADGMGGMNAGEIASQIAIETVREEFAPDKITDNVILSRFSIEKFMNDVIVKADSKIKEVSALRPETKGMGTTIVLAWLFQQNLYVSWCGDSRAYVYNPKFGLHRLTKDHSYVQQLVDAGKLSDEEAFDFPDSNIITRCLSDAKQKGQPESLSKPYPVSEGDVILLCTDGLCGMIRDPEIGTVVESNLDDLGIMTDSLIQAALDASGADNVTICLCQIVSGGAKANDKYFQTIKSAKIPSQEKSTEAKYGLLKKSLIPLLCLFFLVLGGFATWLILPNASTVAPLPESDSTEALSDSDSCMVVDSDINDTMDNEEETAETTANETSERSLNATSETSKKNVSELINSINDSSKPQSTSKIESKKSEAGGLTLNHSNDQSQKTDSVQCDTLSQQSKEVVEEILPEGMSLKSFREKYGMTSNDMENLNPQIENWKKVQPGTKLNVYKKKE